jgi:hypothetical protein
MSAFGGKADIIYGPAKGPLLAITGPKGLCDKSNVARNGSVQETASARPIRGPAFMRLADQAVGDTEIGSFPYPPDRCAKPDVRMNFIPAP